MMPQCPLCRSQKTVFFMADKFREYEQCGECKLVFVPPHFYLSRQAEKAEYDLHQNLQDDPGYRKFLGRLFEPMMQRLQPNSFGLDFGSGPGPTLSLMFQEAGHRMYNYDKFYADDASVLQQQYDFIIASETVEHLHHPGQTLNKLWRILNPGGYLGIMTKLVIDKNAFSTWHYKNDKTHVCFFSQDTFLWLAEKWQGEIEFVGKDVVIVKKL